MAVSGRLIPRIARKGDTMDRRFWRGATLAILSVLAVSLVGCSQFGALKAKKAVKEAHSLYQQQEYKRAAVKYEECLANDPNRTEAYFYLGNSYDQLYKPSRKGEAENDGYLTKAIENYKKAADLEPDLKIKALALKFLISAYGPDKMNDASQSESIVQRMIQLDPTDVENYFGLAKISEDAGEYEKAEQALLKAKEVKPNDSSVYLQLAGFYNRQEEFDKTIEALEQRTSKEPNNPEAYYTTAGYFWEKAYRDFRLKDAEKKKYVEQGIAQVNKALQLKPDYMEAIVYKNLLLRLQANLEKDPAVQQTLIKEADRLRDLAADLKKKKVSGVGG
jgi:tetratricopeptide (TPR) repeat protein